MSAALPYRDINVHSSPAHYAFSSPSSPHAPTLVVDRPSGALRLHHDKLPAARRVSSIAGILGIIALRLGTHRPCLCCRRGWLTRRGQTSTSSSSPRRSPWAASRGT